MWTAIARPRFNDPSAERVRINAAMTDSYVKFNSKLFYERRSVGKSVVISDHHLEPAINFSPQRASDPGYG
jgi:hypothetical protein